MRVHRMTRDEDIARGDRAKHLLEDEDLRSGFLAGESAMADLVAEQQQIRKTSDDTGAVRNRLEEAETARADWALRDQWKWERGQTS